MPKELWSGPPAGHGALLATPGDAAATGDVFLSRRKQIMATVEHKPEQTLAVSDWADAERSKATQYLAKRLAETRADFKSVAVAAFTLGLAVAGLAWLAVGVLLEHWWLAGGMPVWLRWTWLLAGLVGAAAATVRWLVPLLRYRVNLVYAARTIEQEFPELHNDLVNAVLVRPQGGDPRADLIARSLDRRAARQLTSLPADGVIDKQHLVRLAAVLALLVIAASLYALLSPKSPFVTAGRLLAPWSSWAAPSRVTIEAVECFWTTAADDVRLAEAGEPPAGERLLDPRRLLPVEQDTVRLVRGRQLVFAAAINHLGGDEIPTVEVTPLLDDGSIDRRAEPWQATLRRAAAADRYLVRLPSAAAGLDRSVRLRLAAGDARLQPLTVLVVDAPSLLVREAEYRFPAYTGRPPETRQWQGDLRGLEGTEVLLQAESNQPLDAAWIDFLDTEREDDLRLAVDAKQPTLARTSLTLRLAADRAGAEHPSYRLRFRPRGEQDAGAADIIAEPLTHRIEVLPDLAPEVAIDHPEEEKLRVPPRGPVRIRVRAVDPDYALTSVRVETRPLGGGAVRERQLWQADPAQADARGSSGLRVSTRVVPAEDAAGADVLEYRAVVLDNRQPEPNTSATPWRQLIIDDLAPPPADPEPQWPERKPEDQGRDGQGDASAADADGAADAKPEQPAGEDANTQPGGGVTQPENQPPPADNQQQPGKQGGESGMQDASGTAGPKEGQGKQGPQGAQQQSGQPGAGKQPPQAGEAREGGKAGNPPVNGKPSGGESQTEGGANKQASDQRGGERGGKAAGDERQPEGKAADRGDPAKAAGGEQRPGAGEQRPQDGQQRPGGEAEAGGNGRPQDRQPGGQDQPATNGERMNGEPAGSPPPKPTVAADGTDDGEAMERILDHQRRQSGEQPGQQQDNQQQQSGECRPEAGEPCGEAGCSTCNGGGAAGGGKPGGGKPGGGKPGGGKPGGGQPGGGQPGASQPGGGQPGGDRPGGAAASESADAGQGSEKGAAAAGGAGEADGGQSGTMPAEGQPDGATESGGGESDSGEPAGQAGAGGETADAAEAKAGAGQPAAGQPGDETNPPSGGQAGEGDQPGEAAAGAGAAGGTPAGSTAGGGGGGEEGGDQPADRQDDAATAEPKPLEWEEPDLSTVRRAADLALEHLRDSVRSGDEEVLAELGWSREQAEAFLNRWEAMRQAATSGDAGERQEFEQTLRSLGLRPEGVRSSRKVPTDGRGPQAESRRTRPPLDYRERFKAYLKGTDSRMERE